MSFEDFATALFFGVGCFTLGVLVTLAVQGLAGLCDGEVRR